MQSKMDVKSGMRPDPGLEHNTGCLEKSEQKRVYSEKSKWRREGDSVAAQFDRRVLSYAVKDFQKVIHWFSGLGFGAFCEVGCHAFPRLAGNAGGHSHSYVSSRHNRCE